MKPQQGAIMGVGVLLFLLLPWPLARWASFFISLTLGLSWLWSRVVATHLEFSVGKSLQRGFSGQKMPIEFCLVSKSPVPSGLLWVFDTAADLEVWGETRFFVEISAHAAHRFVYHVRGRERGPRSLGPLVVLGSDPSGFFPFEIRSKENRTLLLYPNVFGLENSGVLGWPLGTRRFPDDPVEDPSRFLAFRSFAEGDALASLSASESARRGVLTVRQAERTRGRPVVVVLDFQNEHFALRRRWQNSERAAEIAASLVWQALSNGQKVWLVTDAVTPDRPEGGVAVYGPLVGWEDARFFLEALAWASLAPPWKSAARDWLAALPPPPAVLWWVGGWSPPEEIEMLGSWHGRFVMMSDYEAPSKGVWPRLRVRDWGEIDLANL